MSITDHTIRVIRDARLFHSKRSKDQKAQDFVPATIQGNKERLECGAIADEETTRY